MIILIIGHGGQTKDKFPNWTPKKLGEKAEGPAPVHFYFAVNPNETASRATDIFCRNLILNMDGAKPPLPTKGFKLSVGTEDFVPDSHSPNNPAEEAPNIIKDMETQNHGMGGPWKDKPTYRMWPDKGAEQHPLFDYVLKPYANGKGNFTPEEWWGDWPPHLGGPMNERPHNPHGRVWVVSKPDGLLSTTVKNAWNAAKSHGLMGNVAVVCLFCRSS
jgi:hypothetical protein